MANYVLAFILLLGLSPATLAEAIPFDDYIFLKEGMSEGEVLLRVGPPDFVSVVDNFYLQRRIWYYLPDGNYSGDRLTELTFDVRGKVIQIERSNPLTRFRR